MKYDLKSMSRKELEKLRSDIDKTLERVSNREMKAALAAAEKAAKAHGFSLAEITLDTATAEKPQRKKATANPKTSGKPKYVNPKDKTQTWTGKGRRPDWFVAATDSGKTPEQLEIK